MMTFTVLLAIAAGVIMLQLWEGNTKQVRPIRIETEEQPQKRYRGRR
jgi:hypothetical protein